MAIESRESINSHLDSEIVSGLATPITATELNTALKKITESFYNKVDDVPPTDNEYTVFCVWAEENADLAAGAQEWGFGSGDETPLASGIVLPLDCELFAMGLNVEGGTATVRTVVNDDIDLADYEVSVTQAPTGFSSFSSVLQINAGDVINFRTIASSGTNTNSARVSAFFRVKASLLSTSTISNLIDTSLAQLSANQVLVYDGSNWINSSLDYASLLNTPVLADESIGTHSDIDITTNVPALGDSLIWDGSHFMPYTSPEGYTIFSIWAEEATDLSTGSSQEWAFGNGDDTPISSGIVIPTDCELFAMGLNVEDNDATVGIVVNGDLKSYELYASSPSAFTTFTTPLEIKAGDVVNFRTISSSGNTTSGRVSAFFKIKLSKESTSVLSDIEEVSLTTAAAKDVLQYDGSNWVNKPLDYAILSNRPSEGMTNGLESLIIDSGVSSMNSSGYKIYNAILALTENTALSISGSVKGDYGTLIIDQDATVAYELTLPSNSKIIGATGLMLTPAVNERMILSYFYDGNDFNWNYKENYS